jgi:phage tail-like protein
MAILRDKPYSNMNFNVDIGGGGSGGPDAGLVEVIFPEARIQFLEYRSGQDKVNEHVKTLALTRYGNLILKRGAIGSLTWYDWWSQARNGNPSVNRTVVVHLLNEDQTAVVLTWRFLRAIPSNYQYSALNAVAAETLIESLELTFEHMELE